MVDLKIQPKFSFQLLFLGRQLVLVWHKQEDDREDQELEDIDDTLDLESTLDSVKADAEAEEEVLAED